jgi:hypothetical protein
VLDICELLKYLVEFCVDRIKMVIHLPWIVSTLIVIFSTAGAPVRGPANA